MPRLLAAVLILSLASPLVRGDDFPFPFAHRLDLTTVVPPPSALRLFVPGDSLEAMSEYFSVLPRGFAGSGVFLARPELTASPHEGLQFKYANEGEWGSLFGQVVIVERAAPSQGWEDPARSRSWKREDAWHSPATAGFFVFGQLGANNGETALEENMKVVGKGGVACKLPCGNLGELLVRSGPAVTYNDPLHPERTREKSEWLLEVEGRWPLLAGIGLEYQGTISPALSMADKNAINHDLRLAFPLGENGKLRLGAKQKWEGASADPKAGISEMELYVGMELKR